MTRYGSAGPRPQGTVMTVEFELGGKPVVALNGGPQFSFSEAVSFQVDCETQEDVDSLWTTLAEGGEEGPCGWLKDRFGLSWQIIPNALPRLLNDPDAEKAQRVMAAMLKMGKIEIAELERAADGAAIGELAAQEPAQGGGERLGGLLRDEVAAGHASPPGRLAPMEPTHPRRRRAGPQHRRSARGAGTRCGGRPGDPRRRRPGRARSSRGSRRTSPRSWSRPAPPDMR